MVQQLVLLILALAPLGILIISETIPTIALPSKEPWQVELIDIYDTVTGSLLHLTLLLGHSDRSIVVLPTKESMKVNVLWSLVSFCKSLK